MKRVLIIDGSRMIWSFYRVLLKSLKNLEIYFAEDLDKALEYLLKLAQEGHRPDLVICEMECPGWDGFPGQHQGGVDFLKFLKQDASTTKVNPYPEIPLENFNKVPIFLVTSEEHLNLPGCSETITKSTLLADECFRKRDILQAGNQSSLVAIIRRYLEIEQGGDFPPAQLKPNRPPIKTLVVEDDIASRTVIVKYLERTGFIVSIAQNSGQALAEVKKNPPDIILLDIGLPDSSGLKVVKELKNHPETAHIPIIAVSARAMEQDIKQGLEAGLDHYHTKPVDFSKLLESIEKLVGH